MNMYVTEQHIIDHSISELDFELRDEFNFDDGEDYENQFIIIDKSSMYMDGSPMKIEVLEKLIAEAKEKQATHITIDTHIDHIGYNILFSKIGISTEDEIKEYEDKINEEEEKRNKINELQAEINKLRK